MSKSTRGNNARGTDSFLRSTGGRSRKAVFYINTVKGSGNTVTGSAVGMLLNARLMFNTHVAL